MERDLDKEEALVQRGSNGEDCSNGEKVNELDREGTPSDKIIDEGGVPAQRELHGERLLVKKDLNGEWI